VRFQCALSLGAMSDARIASALAQMATRDADDRWARAAVLSSVSGHQNEFLTALLSRPTPPGQGTFALLSEAARLLGMSQSSDQLASSLNLLVTQSTMKDFAAQAALLTGFANSLRNRAGDGLGNTALLNLLARTEVQSAAREAVEALFNRARDIALDAQQPTGRRVSAVMLLAHANYERSGEVLRSLASAQQPTELAIAAVRALGEFLHPEVAQALLAPDRWGTFPPALREAVLAALFSRPQHLSGLLAAIEAGTFPAAAVDFARRNQLLRQRDEAIRTRAEKLFKQTAPGDRMKVYEESKSALTLKPVASNGREVFKRLCANCHRFEREGIAVGPDIFDIRNQPKESILLHIIVPEYEIAPNYTAYVIETKDGRTLTGLMVSETATSVTLRQALAAEETVLRSNVASMTASSVSLMPQELEKGMSRQELADLLAYLKGEGD
jgi:putative heme-binding domain-containing protein